MDSLVTTTWLAEDMAASIYASSMRAATCPTRRNAQEEFAAGHIPGALFMDLAELVDADALVENTLPRPRNSPAGWPRWGWATAAGSCFTMIRDPQRGAGMVHAQALRGTECGDPGRGLAKWRAEERAVSTQDSDLRSRHFTAWQHARALRSKAQMLANIQSQAEQVVDARGAARFAGTAPEPRPGMQAGHIPGAINVPYTQMFKPDGTFKDKAGIKSAFETAGVDLSKPIVTSCGSGVTACVLIFGLFLIGKTDVALYDGSWAEWGADPETPKETGASRPVNA
jgi:thiosulfate/3-mercaptopyruvate sulfurtransferase